MGQLRGVQGLFISHYFEYFAMACPLRQSSALTSSLNQKKNNSIGALEGIALYWAPSKGIIFP